LSQQRWAPPPVPHSLTNSAYHHLLHAPSLLNRPFLSDPQQQQLQQLPALGSSQTASVASPFTGATTTQSLSWPLSLDQATLARLQWSAVLPNAQFGSSTTLDISTLLAQTDAAASSNSSSTGQAPPPPPPPSNSDNGTASEAAPAPGATQQEA
jgi:hypothetical protein